MNTSPDVPAAAPVLCAARLQVGYPGQPPVAVDWTATLGSGLALLHGDTGSGKSTLLRTLAGVVPALRGELSIHGTHLSQDADAYRDAVFLFDPSAGQDETRTAQACLERWRAADTAFDVPCWHAAVEGFALAPHLDKPLYMLSTGSKRKVMLAGALATSRALVLLDEPTAALDAASVRHLWRLLGERAGRSARPAQVVVVASGERVAAVPFSTTIGLPLR